MSFTNNHMNPSEPKVKFRGKIDVSEYSGSRELETSAFEQLNAKEIIRLIIIRGDGQSFNIKCTMQNNDYVTVSYDKPSDSLGTEIHGDQVATKESSGVDFFIEESSRDFMPTVDPEMYSLVELFIRHYNLFIPDNYKFEENKK